MVQAIAAILKIASTPKILVSLDAPYSWESGKHDILLTKPNFPIIGMAWIHEGGKPTAYDAVAYKAAKEAAEAESPKAGDAEKFLEHQFLKYFSEVEEQLSNWYLILVACTQVRELSNANLENFCKMAKTQQLPARTLIFLSYWASRQGLLVESEDLRTKFSDNRFFEYHTTGSSTPQLCIEAISEVKGLDIFSDEEVASVVDAVAESHDVNKAREITAITLVKARAVHEASGTLPDIWYMGQRALDRFSGKRYGAIVKYLKAIFDIQMKTSGIGEMDIETLKRNLKELIDG